MRPYIVHSSEIRVDLDDPIIYEHLPKTVYELRDRMFKQIGYQYLYTKFWHVDIFDNKENMQKKRIKKLIWTFAVQESDRMHNDDVLWFQEQVFLFEDEIENMC
jgi:hypothetical protein